MNKKYKILLFDLDGTLTDPKEGITKCIQYALHAYGIEEPDLEKLTKYIGPPLKESFRDYFEEDKLDEAIAKYRERYISIGINENRLYYGMPELLLAAKQQGKKIALATSKPERFAIMVMEQFDIAKYFDCMTGGEVDGVRDTKAAVIEEVFHRMKLTSADLSEVLMIGDRMYDIEGAIACGIDSLGVRFGYAAGSELEDAGATYVVSTVEELKEFILLH